jgi:hypothetical protein
MSKDDREKLVKEIEKEKDEIPDVELEDEEPSEEEKDEEEIVKERGVS